MSKLISYTTTILVIALTLVSMILSYDALQSIAFAYGVPEGLSYLWPFLVDGALVVFSLAVVYNASKSEPTLWPWSLVGLFTVGTIVFNLIHSPANRVSWLVAIVPPVALFLSFETLMGMLKSGVRRSELAQTLDNLGQLVESKRQELEARANQLANLESESSQRLGQLQEQIGTMERTIQSYRQDIEAKQLELKSLDSGQSKIYLPANLSIEQRRELVNRLANDKMTNEDIAAALGCSVGTIKNDKKANGEIVQPIDIEGTYGRNGNGKARV